MTLKPSGVLYHMDEACSCADKYKLDNLYYDFMRYVLLIGTGLVQTFPGYEDVKKLKKTKKTPKKPQKRLL